MRALVVTSMFPSDADPGRGAFVRDQVRALAAREDVELELFTFPPGLRSYPRAARAVRRRFAGRRFDVVHAHFGLTAWPVLAAPGRVRLVTLHGTDLAHPRSRRITRAALRAGVLPATVSARLATRLPGAGRSRRVLVLPCGVDTARFHPIPRAEARAVLDLPADEPALLFAADPARPGKRFDRARALAGAAGVRLLTLGGVPPERVPLLVNAANAVLVPSETEGFGLAVLEALACDVPVAATPVGVHPIALRGIEGAHCGSFALERWRAALAPHLAAADPRVAGRDRAALFAAERMAERVAVAWQALATERPDAGPPLYSRADRPPRTSPARGSGGGDSAA